MKSKRRHSTQVFLRAYKAIRCLNEQFSCNAITRSYCYARMDTTPHLEFYKKIMGLGSVYPCANSNELYVMPFGESRNTRLMMIAMAHTLWHDKDFKL